MTTTNSVVLQDDAEPADNADAVTVIQSTNPPRVGKSYYLDDAGGVKKRQVANITEGMATSYATATTADMAENLKYVTGRTDSVMCPAAWHGDNGEPFAIVTERRLSDLLGFPVGSPELAGVHLLPPQGLIAARLRRGLTASSWLLLDADNPPGIPETWAAMDAAQRLALWEDMLPGLSACERIELRGSSARVVAPGEPDAGPTHIWLRVSNPEMLATLKAFVGVRMVLDGVSFESPRHSRVDGRVIGHARRSVFDLSVWDAGRLVFCAQPEISEAMATAGYRVTDADVRIVNPGGGPLDISGIEMPTAEDLAAYAEVTGERITFDGTSGNIVTHSRGVLTPQSEIIVRGVVDTLENWLATIPPGGQLRCEAPFRGSESEAAFIRRIGEGLCFVHDIGNGTTYHLDVDAMRNEAVASLADAMAPFLPPGLVEQVRQASEQRQAPALAATAANAATVSRNIETAASVDDMLNNAAPYVFPDEASLPRRDWLMAPDYLRGHISVTVAPGGAGKSSLILVEALALASGKPLLPPRIPLALHNVCTMNSEDDMDEVNLRLAAARKMHNIAQEDIADGLYVMHPGDLVLVRADGAGRAVEASDIVDRLIEFLKQKAIDVLILDPLASYSEGEENSNTDMAVLIKASRRIARAAGVALKIVHHTRKTGGNAATAEDARGASALIAGARQASVLNTMTGDQAREHSIPEKDRRRYFSITNGKSNYAEPGDDQWCEIVPVVLANGERVATVRPWQAPAVAAPYAVVQAVHAYLVANGPQRSSTRAGDWFGWTVATLAGVEGAAAHTAAAKDRAKRWLARLLEHGVIVEGEARNAARQVAPGYVAGTMPGEAWPGVL